MDTPTGAGTAGTKTADITIAEIADALIRADTGNQLSLTGWYDNIRKSVEVKPGEYDSLSRLNLQSREGRLENPGRTDIGFSEVDSHICVYLGDLAKTPAYCYPIVRRANDLLDGRLYSAFGAGIPKGNDYTAALLARRLTSGR